MIGDTLYGFEVAHVREILQGGQVTALPHMADEIAGVTDHRNEVIPIVDLRIKFGLLAVGARAATHAEKWIVVKVSFGVVGFVVDRVIDVVGTNESLGPAPLAGGSIDRAISGVATLDEGLLFVLDPERLAGAVRAVAPALPSLEEENPP